MPDASSIRFQATLPTATGRNRGSVRFNSTANEPVVSDGSNWLVLTPSAESWTQSGEAAATSVIFVAPRAGKILAVKEVHSTAGSDAGAVTATVTKDTGTNAPGAGTAVLTNTFNLKGTANTVQSGTLSGSAATLAFAAGDRISLKTTGVTTAVAGLTVTVLVAWF